MAGLAKINRNPPTKPETHRSPGTIPLESPTRVNLAGSSILIAHKPQGRHEGVKIFV